MSSPRSTPPPPPGRSLTLGAEARQKDLFPGVARGGRNGAGEHRSAPGGAALAPVILTREQTSNIRGQKPPDSAVSCRGSYISVACGCGFKVVFSGCMSVRCPNCQEKVGRRRARRVRDRMERGRPNAAGRKKAVIYTICTVPPELRERFLDRTVWRAAVKKFWRVLSRSFGGEYAVECSHPIGDENPQDFHPHLNLLWVQRNGYKPYLDVAELRRQWGLILETYSIVDVWTSYYTTKTPARAWNHRYKYVTRTFPEYSEWVGAMRWYGKYPRKKKDETPEIVTCPGCGEPYLFLGRATMEDYCEYMANDTT